MTVVVDASVALKWFLPDEPETDRALAILRGGEVLAAPDLIFAEVCNGAWKSARLGRITQNQVSEIATALPTFFGRVRGSGSLATRGVEIAGWLDHPVYDCLYIALAEMEQCALVTADLQLIARIRGTEWKTIATALANYR